jgi:hypothetical protein
LIKVNEGFRRDQSGFLGENAPLTKNITAFQWQSQDDAPYMRAGFTVLIVIEELMSYFGATDHILRTDNPSSSGSGYRSRLQNDTLSPDLLGFHVNGTAADITLIGSNSIDSCEVLYQANEYIGRNGQAATEGKANTRHIAIPATYWFDNRRCP